MYSGPHKTTDYLSLGRADIIPNYMQYILVALSNFKRAIKTQCDTIHILTEMESHLVHCTHPCVARVTKAINVSTNRTVSRFHAGAVALSVVLEAHADRIHNSHVETIIDFANCSRVSSTCTALADAIDDFGAVAERSEWLIPLPFDDTRNMFDLENLMNRAYEITENIQVNGCHTLHAVALVDVSEEILYMLSMVHTKNHRFNLHSDIIVVTRLLSYTNLAIATDHITIARQWISALYEHDTHAVISRLIESVGDLQSAVDGMRFTQNAGLLDTINVALVAFMNVVIDADTKKRDSTSISIVRAYEVIRRACMELTESAAAGSVACDNICTYIFAINAFLHDGTLKWVRSCVATPLSAATFNLCAVVELVGMRSVEPNAKLHVDAIMDRAKTTESAYDHADWVLDTMVAASHMRALGKMSIFRVPTRSGAKPFVRPALKKSASAVLLHHRKMSMSNRF